LVLLLLRLAAAQFMEQAQSSVCNGGCAMSTFCEGCEEYGEGLERAHDALLTDHLKLQARCRELCALLEICITTATTRQVIAEARALCGAVKGTV
jgi:hypothetical protein